MPGTNLTRDEARERAALVRVDDYTIDLDLTAGDTTFVSDTTVRFSCTTPGAATFIDLIAPAVREVTLNGQALDPADVFDGARVTLPGLAAENTLRVVADAAYMNTGEGLHRFVDPVDDEVYLYSQFEVADARRVFTCFDQPDLKGRFTFRVTAPEHWRVISNSPTPDPEPSGEGAATWRFATTPVLPTYVTAVVAGPYRGGTGELTSSDGRTIPLGVYCRASLAEHLDAEEVMDVTRRGFAHYEQTFDRAYPFEKYDQIFVPEFNAGAMENAGAVTFLENYVFRSKPTGAMVERRALTILHELAHMWFGDLVTMRWWDDLWLNESFAEYTSTHCQVEATRWESAWTTFLAMEKAWAYRQDQLPSTHPIVAEINDLADVEVNFDGITYAKGASVLKQLVAWVGRDAFEAGLRTYFTEHAWGNTELTDLLRHLEATSGRDLGDWSRQWLEQAGVNTLRPQVQVAPDGTIAQLTVLQEAPAEHPHLRPHRLVVSGYDDDGDGRLVRVWRSELDVDGAATPVPEAAGRPLPQILLVNDEDLAYAKVRLDEASLAAATRRLSEIADPLPRSLIWSAAWDMARDAETAPRDYVDLVAGNVAAEHDSSVVLSLLRQAASAVQVYVAAPYRLATRESLVDTLIDLAGTAEPGGDQQLQFVKFAAQLATGRHVDWLSATLAGDGPAGLTVDADLRWELLTALVVAGARGEADIAAELRRDDTATGRRAAAGARAALPDAAAKQAAWESVAVRDDLPNAVQGAVIAGFARALDEELLTPFVEPYFELLETVWEQRTSEMAQQLVIGLYPTGLASPQLLERTHRWLTENPQAPAALRRLVLENADGVRRLVACQERDALR